MLELLQTVIMEEEEEGDKEGQDTAWGEVFSRLDKGDGREDGKIKCADFIEWIDTLTFQDSVSLEVGKSTFNTSLLSTMPILARCAKVCLEKSCG